MVFIVVLCVLVTGINFGFHLITNILHVNSPIILIVAGSAVYFVYTFYFIFCVIAYAAILIKISKSRRRIEASTNLDATLTTFQFICATFKRKDQHAVIPFLITLSNMVFLAVPFVAMMTCTFNGCFMPAFHVWRVTFALNSISDALIYVLFDRKIRNHMKKTISSRRRRKSGDRSEDRVVGINTVV